MRSRPGRLFCFMMVWTSAIGCRPKASSDSASESASSATPKGPASATTAATAMEAGASDPLPKDAPRFAWKAPLSVPVEEDIAKSGQRIRLQFILDVCPRGQGGALVIAHRDVRLAQVNGQAANRETSPEVKQIESLLAAMPAMIISPTGSFVDATGFEKMLGRMAATYPDMDFSKVRRALATPAGSALVKQEMATRWEGWVPLWLAFDPAKGVKQSIRDNDAESEFVMTFDGLGPDGRVRLSGQRSMTKSERDALLPTLLSSLGITDLDPSKAAITEVITSANVETEWPELRPWSVGSRKSLRINVEGKEETLTEQHDYRFDWRAATHEGERCR